MAPALRTAVTTRLGIVHPVLSAPMAGVAGGALAAAVSRAGGFGFIGGGYGDADWLDREFDAAEGARIGVGFITWALDAHPSLLDRALARGPAAVFLSFGDLRPYAARVRAAGVPLLAQVQTLAQAQAALDAGADILVAQGTEAGGHGGARATLPLVPAVVDLAGQVPVLAAGGVADGRGLAAVLALGAAGAVCGTAFFASPESLANPAAKAAALAASGDGTRRGRVFDAARGLDWPADWDLRALANPFFTAWAGSEDALRASDARMAYANAVALGDTAVAAVIVGEAVDLVRRSEPAGDVVRRLVAQAQERIVALAAVT